MVDVAGPRDDATGAPRRRTVRTALLVLALAACAWLAGPGGALTDSAHARRAPSPRAQLVRLLAPVPALTRRLPRTLAPLARRRDRGQATAALAAARRGDFCAVATAVAQIDRVGRVRARLTAVTRLLERRRLTAGCVDRGQELPRITARTVDGGGTAPPEPPRPDEHEQGDVAPLPIGPHRDREGPRPPAAQEDTSTPAGGAAPARTARTRPFDAFSTALTDPLSVFARGDVPVSGGLTPLDPSSATAGDVVLVTGNRYLSLSTDGGRTFTSKDPRDVYATADPVALRDPDGGACCDQVVHYDRATDRFYWLLQYWCTVQTDCRKRPGENRLRLAVASPKDVAESGGTRWRFWDITSRDVGLRGHWLDFPDLAVGGRFLYLTVNSPSANTAVWARMRKTALRDGTLDGWYHTYAGENTLKPVQDVPGNRRYGLVVRRSSTSELEVKRWPETLTATSSSTIPIATTATQDCAVTSPDGLDAFDGQDTSVAQRCGGPSARISGAAMEYDRTSPRIWVAWTAGRREEGTKNPDGSDRFDGADSGYPLPHVELAVLNARGSALVRQSAVWSTKTAYAYPYLAGGPEGEVAMTYMAMAANQYPGWGVGLLTGKVSLARVVTGTAGASRVGDYLAVRRAWPNSKLFAATGNVLTKGGFDARYVLFGRRGDRPLATRRPDQPIGPLPVPTPGPGPIPVPSPLPSGNLIVNPGAEQGTAADDATTAVSPPGWTASAAGLTQVRYGAPGGFPDAATSQRLGGGAAFFAGGPGVQVRFDPDRRTLVQTIDLTSAAAEIDRGGVRASLSGLLGGYAAQGDAATLKADFGDGANRPTLLTLTAGPVTVTDRDAATTLLPRSASGILPAGTRRVRVEIDFDRAPNASGTYNDGSADNLSLTLQRAAP